MFHNQVTWITLHYYEFGKLSYHSNWNDQLLVTLNAFLYFLSYQKIPSGVECCLKVDIMLN